MNEELQVELQEALKQEKQEMTAWVKALMRHTVPETRSLKPMLQNMTLRELQDIRANLDVKGAGRLRKAELAARLEEAVPPFARKWLQTIVQSEYRFLTRIADAGGVLTVSPYSELTEGADRLRAMGIIGCGMHGGKFCWYMPEEILQIFRSFEKESFEAQILRNTTIGRIVTGCLYYYGFLPFEELFSRVQSYLSQKDIDADQEEITGILLNLAEWSGTVAFTEDGVVSGALTEDDFVREELAKRESMPYAEFSYDEIFAAGADTFLEETPAVRSFLYYFLKQGTISLVAARDLLENVIFMLQNGRDINEIFVFVVSQGHPDLLKKQNVESGYELLQLLVAINNEMHLWIFKGHSPQELAENAGRGILFHPDPQAQDACQLTDPM